VASESALSAYDDLTLSMSEDEDYDVAVAADFRTGGHSARNWVRVSDLQLWPELARESHQFVGEPPVGGQS
jgi:hypothetical protein